MSTAMQKGSHPAVSSHFSTRPGTLSLIKLLLCSFLHLGVTKAFPVVSIFEEDEGKPADDPQLWAYLGTAIALVLLGGAFAGLTIALMGQDEVYLQVLAESGEGSEKKAAKKVLKLLGRGKHWVLVTLLVGNVITNETLPIVLDRSIGGGYAAVVSSTVLVIIFGEIVPQSICVRYGLSIGAWMAPFVLVLMWLLAIICWPIAKLLDYLLGKDHGTTYKKAGLKTLVTLHQSLGDGGERLNEDEVSIISGVLDLKAKSVGSIMTPMGDVFTLSSDAILDEEMMNTIMSEGYSRIPIHDPKNKRDFVGMLLVKMLITYDPEDAKAVNTFSLATLPETAQGTSCLDIINFFQEGKSHMVLVSDFPGEPHGALGVVTLEDVIEELIGEEIIDESDVYVDIHKAIRRTPAPTHRAHIHRVETGNDTDATLVSDGDAPTHPPKQERKLSAGLLRRPSSTSGSTSGQSMQRRNYPPELRAQFKNLGPSNSARKPKLSRVNTVKIKPGVGSIPENTALTNHAASAAPPSQSSANASQPLLAPTPNNQFPTNAAATLQANYGTWDAPATLPPTSSNPERYEAHDDDVTTESEALSAAVDSNQLPPPSPALERPPKIIIERHDSHSTLGSLHSNRDNDDDDKNNGGSKDAKRSHSEAGRKKKKKKGSDARSGSITENIVDAGGVKKLVLGTVSSPSGSGDDDDDDEDGAEEENAVVSAAANGRLAQTDGEGAIIDDDDERKKTTRRKRGKKGRGEENAPLLGGEEA